MVHSVIVVLVLVATIIQSKPLPGSNTDATKTQLEAQVNQYLGGQYAQEATELLNSDAAKPYIDKYGASAVEIIKENGPAIKSAVTTQTRHAEVVKTVTVTAPKSAKPTATVRKSEVPAASPVATPKANAVAVPTFGSFAYSGNIDSYALTSYDVGDVASWEKGMLYLSNLARARHGAAPLVLDSSLTAVMQTYMSGGMGQGSGNCWKLGDYQSKNLVSNTWAVSSSAVGVGSKMTLEAVSAWYNEGAELNWKSSIEDQVSANIEGLGHFSQLVWKGTTKLGCAFHQCSGSVSVGCMYSSRGNVVQANLFPTNVLPKLNSAPSSDKT